MQGYMATLSAMEYECDKAIAEYKSFMEFCGTFEGDEIPDDLYTVAQEVYGADLARSAGEAIVKFAKKIWEWIVRFIKAVGDWVAKAFSSMKYKSSYAQLKRLKEKLASDRETYDARLSTITKFIPDKNTFNTYQTNLAVMLSATKRGVMMSSLTENIVSSELVKSLSELGCELLTRIEDAPDKSKILVKKLMITGKSGNPSEYTNAVYKNHIVDAFVFGNDKEWNTLDLITAVEAIMTLNVMVINTPIMSLLHEAKTRSKATIDRVKNIDPNAMTQEQYNELIAAQGLVKVAVDIINMESLLTDTLTSMVTRMSAYCISPGALNLNDADLGYKNNNPSSSPFIAFNIGSVLSPFSK